MHIFSSVTWKNEAYDLTEIFKQVKISESEALNFTNKLFEKIASIMSKFLAAYKDLKTVKKFSEAEQMKFTNIYMITMN